MVKEKYMNNTLTSSLHQYALRGAEVKKQKIITLACCIHVHVNKDIFRGMCTSEVYNPLAQQYCKSISPVLLDMSD